METCKPFSPTYFDFSPCLENRLYAIPIIYFLISYPFEIHNLNRRKRKQQSLPSHKYERDLKWREPGKRSLGVKTLGSLLGVGLTLAMAGLELGSWVKVAGKLGLAVCILLSLPILRRNQLHSLRSSTPILLFYLFTLLLSIVSFRTFLLNNPDLSVLSQKERADFWISIIAFVDFLVIFLLECQGPSFSFKLKRKGKVKLIGEEEGLIARDYADGSGPSDAYGTFGEDEDMRESPSDKANFFSQLTYSWLNPLLELGKKKPLEEGDLYKLRDEDQAEELYKVLQVNWDAQLKKKNPSILLALFWSYATPTFISWMIKLIADCLQFVQPQLLRLLLEFVESYSPDSPQQPQQPERGYLIAVAMLLTAILQSLAQNQYFEMAITTGMRCQRGMVGLLYDKSLKLSNDERNGKATGDIVNLMSTDSTRLQQLPQQLLMTLAAIFQLTLAFISLYDLLGWACLAGVGVMIFSMALNSVVMKYSFRFSKQQMKNRDERSRIMTEILNNIKAIKLYNWEESFTKKLFKVRNDKELKLLVKSGYLDSLTIAIFNFSPFLVAFLSFAVCAYTGSKPLTPDVVFPALSLFALMNFPLSALPPIVISIGNCYISLGRLREFLVGKELQADAVEIVHVQKGELKYGDEVVRVKDGEFSWNSDAQEPILQNIDLTLNKGQLVAVVGVVGSGKSSLLSAILGEMSKRKGEVTLRGKVAYVSQQPWLMTRSVRSNITFGHRWDPEFYDTVLDACALRDDLATFAKGDQTEVGEKGITLSGGQKARVSLARALYSRADIYLLDDPLSALDAHVARHVFNSVVGPNGLLASKARLLCTNAIPFCQQADEIIMLKKGAIVERGNFGDIMAGESELQKLLAEFGKQQEDDGTSSSDSDDTAVVQLGIDEDGTATPESEIVKKTRQESRVVLRRASVVSINKQKYQLLKELKNSTLNKEKKETGQVKWKIYNEYIKASSLAGFAIVIFIIILQQFLAVGQNFFLKDWAEYNSKLEPGQDKKLPYFLGVYFSLGFINAVFSLLYGLTLYAFCTYKSAKTMHDRMFYAVLSSPMSFFETTPVGAILNRFSKDINVIDEALAWMFSFLLRTSASAVSLILVITSTVPPFAIILIPLVILYRKIQEYYLATSREVKRLNSTTRSPIFASFGETLNGVSTIRAYGQTKRFKADNEAKVDRNIEAFLPAILLNRWLGVRLETMGGSIIFVVAVLSVYSITKNHALGAGFIGLIMTYALNTTNTLNGILRAASELETNIVSVERVQEYIELTPEAPAIIPENRPPASWPERGEIEFEGIEARYREGLELILKGIDFKVGGGQKIGICGRTGAGKSTITLILYRILEPVNGRIVMDGVDITKIGLWDLRSKMSIIPQDSGCFEGTLRENLDPTEVATDDAMWKVLEQVRLKEHVQNSMEGGLDAKITEGGKNLSAGQRQLMCLGRALLRGSKVLVMDEATSAVDPESDKQIQIVIREEFKDCTILTIAHRLNTIIDSDKILVLDKGQVAEFDSPSNLLAKTDSIFYGLAAEAGLIKSSDSPTPPLQIL